MGTHPVAPSAMLPAGEPLGVWLARSPAALGPAVAARWAGGLPFLFKVLSVAKPLSIQAHPDKGLAELLHDMRPATYRDANHKPKMAIAVTKFRALFGFAGIQQKLMPHAYCKNCCHGSKRLCNNAGVMLTPSSVSKG